MSCATTTHDVGHSPNTQKQPTVIGHRGGSLEVPENTMAAFSYSRDLGLKWLELDVRMAADGVVVCHDEFLGRLAGQPELEVWKTSISELKKLSVGAPLPSEYALKKLKEFGLEVPRFGSTYANETVPTLAEALTLAHEIGIMVEMKKGPYGSSLADETIAEIRRMGASENVILGSFDPALLDRALELAPEIPLIGIAEEAHMVAEVLKRPIAKLAVSEDLVPLATKLKGEHVALWVWTIRDLSEVKRLREMGVDGLISDIPKKVRDLIAR